ncbi:hypothetical protein V1478_003247 [Vespula squamosa]|uniref:Uncharacterized protein n=1 Tax=Vespula squamosa TaxID=30214 RepID=A0ABD2BS56_VESSQ
MYKKKDERISNRKLHEKAGILRVKNSYPNSSVVQEKSNVVQLKAVQLSTGVQFSHSTLIILVVFNEDNQIPLTNPGSRLDHLAFELSASTEDKGSRQSASDI